MIFKTLLPILVLLPMITSNSNLPDSKWAIDKIVNFVEPTLYTEYNRFLYDIGTRESSNNYKNDKNLPYMGYYQFGKAALRDCKIYVNWNVFKYNPKLQDYAMYKYMYINDYRLRKYKKYIGTTIKGIVITESGLLAGAHIGGAGGMKRFLRSNGRRDAADRNGTKISDYFAGSQAQQTLGMRAHNL